MPMPAADPVRCPKCDSADIRYSHNRGAWDDLLFWLLSLEVLRCRKCNHRFHHRLEEHQDIAERTAQED
jgi:predicted Zn-ribbon and HTH transcriptional regulator